MALTRERVVESAVTILREFGLGDLSMRRLARELDVAAGAIYWHVASKQELLVEVAHRLLSQQVPDSSGTAAHRLRTHLGGVRSALLPVPDAADVVEIAYALDRSQIPALGAVITLLAELNADAAEPMADVLVRHTLGSVAAEQIRRHVDTSHNSSQEERAYFAGIDAILTVMR